MNRVRAASLLLIPLLLACAPAAPPARRLAPTETLTVPGVSASPALPAPPAASAPSPSAASAPLASAAPAASLADSATTEPDGPVIENGGTAPCYRNTERYGAWKPTTDEVLALIKTFPANCGPRAWQVPALRACMGKAGDAQVVLMHGHVDGPAATERTACQFSVVGAEWSGRRFLVVHNWFRDDAAFFGYNNVYEVIAGAPTLFMDGRRKHSPLCQSSTPGAAEPPGWKDFPAELQNRFCH